MDGRTEGGMEGWTDGNFPAAGARDGCPGGEGRELEPPVPGLSRRGAAGPEPRPHGACSCTASLECGSATEEVVLRAPGSGCCCCVHRPSNTRGSAHGCRGFGCRYSPLLASCFCRHRSIRPCCATGDRPSTAAAVALALACFSWPEQGLSAEFSGLKPLSVVAVFKTTPKQRSAIPLHSTHS